MGFFSQPEVLRWAVNPNEARKKLIQSLDYASVTLDELSTSIAFAEVFADTATRNKLWVYRERMSGVSNKLALPGTTVKNFQSAMKIVKSVSDLSSIGVITPDNAEFAAQAFGRLFSGIGELSHYLPPPINGWFEIFADAENFFVNIRNNLSEEVHMKEEGLRDMIRNL